MDLDKSKAERSKALSFRPRLQFIGTLNWLCAGCGKINREHLTPTLGSWKICCKNRACGAVFSIGWCFWQLPHGAAQRRPLDVGLPASDPFPECETGTLDVARYIHEAVADRGE